MEKTDNLISEHVLEIRYKPDPRILDYRGELALSISNEMKLPKWRIGQNRVDVYEEGELTRVFVSFRNAGVVIRNPSLGDFFPNQSNKFLRFVFTRKPFSRDNTFVQRLGVKSRYAISSQMSFEELLERYMNSVLSLTPEALSAFDAKVIDIGMPLNFSTQIGKINSISGPMEKEQLSSFFKFQKSENLPDVALYLEFDYWLRPEKAMSLKKILSLTKQYAQGNWDRYQRLQALILGA
jgi:hypothetical protein